MEYRYIKATRNGAEAVEFDLTGRSSQYITTCVVSVYRLLIGIKTHPCGNGDDITLTNEQTLAVLKLIQQERNAIKHSGAVKTLAGWQECGLNLNEYLAVLDEVDEALVDEQMNVVPPHVLKSGYLQVGEPYNQEQDENGRWRSTWTTFVANGPKWTYCGLCFSNDTINRVKERDPVQEAIDVIERGGERNA